MLYSAWNITATKLIGTITLTYKDVHLSHIFY